MERDASCWKDSKLLLVANEVVIAGLRKPPWGLMKVVSNWARWRPLNTDSSN